MRCWVSKQGKKGVWSSFLKEFLENIQNEDFGPKFLKNAFKRAILRLIRA